jgi:hypothetical protein
VHQLLGNYAMAADAGVLIERKTPAVRPQSSPV